MWFAYSIVSPFFSTHGSDTLEESAFLFDMTVNCGKPVVVVGSMRPSSSISQDGANNLLSAARTAVSPSRSVQCPFLCLRDCAETYRTYVVVIEVPWSFWTTGSARPTTVRRTSKIPSTLSPLPSLDFSVTFSRFNQCTTIRQFNLSQRRLSTSRTSNRFLRLKSSTDTKVSSMLMTPSEVTADNSTPISRIRLASPQRFDRFWCERNHYRRNWCGINDGSGRTLHWRCHRSRHSNHQE